MLPDYREKKVCIFGIQGSGKTHFAKRLIQSFRAPFIYRITPDFDNEPNAIVFKPTDKYADLELFLHTCRAWGQQRKIDCVVIDEFDLFATETRLEQGILNELILMHRHWGLACIFISRRPQDIPNKVFEQAHYVVNFAIDAPRAKVKFIDLHAEYERLLPSLDFNRHNFILKELGQPPVLCSPIDGKS